MTKLMFIVIVLASTAVTQCKAQEATMELLAAYLETYAKYSSITYRGELRQSPEPRVQSRIVDGLQVRRTFEVKYDFGSRDYWWDTTYWIVGNDMRTRVVKAYIDNLKYAYVDEDSPSLADPRDTGGDGLIDEIDERKQFGGPEFMLGASITMGYGEPLDLKTLIERLPVLIDGDAFEIQNIFQWEDSFGFAYHLRFGLDESKGSLPSWFELIEYNRKLDTREQVVRYEVNKFYQDARTSLWCPVEHSFFLRSKFQTLTVIDESTIAFNRNPSRDEYVVKFPPGKAYIDSRTQQRFLDGEMIEQLEPLPKPFSGVMRSKTGVTGVSLVVLAIILFTGYFYYRRRGVLVALLLLGGVAGCTSGSTASNQSESGKEVDEVLVSRIHEPSNILDPDGNIAIELPHGTRKDYSVRIDADRPLSFEFPIKNNCSEVVQLNSAIKTTCGCTMARATEYTLLPSQTAMVQGEVELATAPGLKSVQMTLVIEKPFFHEIIFSVDVEFLGDWIASTDSLMLVGQLGVAASDVIEISGVPEIIDTIVCETSPLIKVREVARQRENSRVFEFSATPKEAFFSKVLGEVRFISSRGVPATRTIVLSLKGTSLTAWSPPLLRCSPGEQTRCRLAIGKGEKLREITSDVGLKVDEATDDTIDGNTDSKDSSFLIRVDRDATPGNILIANAVVEAGEIIYELPLRVIVKK